MDLQSLTGDIEYLTSREEWVKANVHGDISFPREGDCTYPHPYKSAWNGKIFVSITQDMIDTDRVRLPEQEDSK